MTAPTEPTEPADFTGDAQNLAGDLTELRRDLHRHPERGLDLPRTQERVRDALDGLGLEVTTGKTCTSVTAVLRGTGLSGTDLGGTGSAADAAERPVVLLRADMDALPLREESGVSYRSEVDGVMHACGHDLHTAMLVGAARLLATHRDRVSGDVILMFQPGEEGFNGARCMLEEGVLEASGRRPDAAFALHVVSNLIPQGLVASRTGPLMAASDDMVVTVRGRGGHGSAPHLARDPLPAACEMVLALHGTLPRATDPLSPSVLSIGSLHAGAQASIIPDTARFEATVRTFDPQVAQVVAATAERVCRGVALTHGVEVDFRYDKDYPVTVNSAGETDFALGVAQDLAGVQGTIRIPSPVMASEDFSRVLEQVPGAMLFLGAHAGAGDPRTAPANHSSAAVFDDAVLPTGAALLASLASRRLEKGRTQS